MRRIDEAATLTTDTAVAPDIVAQQERPAPP